MNYASRDISQYAVSENGRLTPLTPRTAPTGESPGTIVVSADGKSVYVTAQGVVGEPGKVWQYDVGANGELSERARHG